MCSESIDKTHRVAEGRPNPTEERCRSPGRLLRGEEAGPAGRIGLLLLGTYLSAVAFFGFNPGLCRWVKFVRHRASCPKYMPLNCPRSSTTNGGWYAPAERERKGPLPPYQQHCNVLCFYHVPQRRAAQTCKPLHGPLHSPFHVPYSAAVFAPFARRYSCAGRPTPLRRSPLGTRMPWASSRLRKLRLSKGRFRIASYTP